MLDLDSYRTVGLRTQMIKELVKRGISSRRVLSWMNNVPRHIFVDSVFERHAYEIKAMPIEQNQTMSSPYTVAFQTEWLEVEPPSKILEIGTGSGYQCAVLCEAGAEVYSIEYVEELHKKACDTLYNKLKYKPHLYFGDGSKGLQTEAPFDRIIVTAGAPSVPEDLLTQLKTGGILVIPVGEYEKQQMTKFKKISAHKITKVSAEDFKFVPLKGKDGWL